MNAVLYSIHFACGMYVLIEAFNRLERLDPFDGHPGVMCRLGGLCWLLTPWRWKRPKVLQVIDLSAWASLAIGAAGALVTPLMHLQKPSLQDLAVIAGTALLIANQRFKEMP